MILRRAKRSVKIVSCCSVRIMPLSSFEPLGWRDDYTTASFFAEVFFGALKCDNMALMKTLPIIFAAIALSGCASTSVKAPTEKFVNDVLPKGAYTERYKHANTNELERIDVDMPCKHFKGLYYFPAERYAALMIKDREALGVYYPDIVSGIVLNPRVFVNDVGFGDVRMIGEHCAIELQVNETELRVG